MALLMASVGRVRVSDLNSMTRILFPSSVLMVIASRFTCEFFTFLNGIGQARYGIFSDLPWAGAPGRTIKKKRNIDTAVAFFYCFGWNIHQQSHGNSTTRLSFRLSFTHGDFRCAHIPPGIAWSVDIRTSTRFGHANG
jgi:hypothetical protein